MRIITSSFCLNSPSSNGFPLSVIQSIDHISFRQLMFRLKWFTQYYLFVGWITVQILLWVASANTYLALSYPMSCIFLNHSGVIVEWHKMTTVFWTTHGPLWALDYGYATQPVDTSHSYTSLVKYKPGIEPNPWLYSSTPRQQLLSLLSHYTTSIRAMAFLSP